MKKILEHLNIEKLGSVIEKPYTEFTGRLAAKVLRRGNIPDYVAVKWNPLTLAPDIAFDPHVSGGQVSEIVELYANPAGSDVKEKIDLSAFDQTTVAAIKEELTTAFGLKTTALNGKKKDELWEMLQELKAEADNDANTGSDGNDNPPAPDANGGNPDANGGNPDANGGNPE